MQKMHDFYDRALASLGVEYAESFINTAYGKTHIVIIGDQNKKKIFTLHGGNGINPLNIKLLKPLLKNYCIIAPDVIGMPGKSSCYRTLSSSKDDYGIWINEVMEILALKDILFVVSSYSASMLLSLAKMYPNRISKAVLLVPAGIAHGPLIPIIFKMSIPFSRYYIHPTNKNLKGIMQTMITDGEREWEEFMHLMMSGYKMEMRPPKEYKKEELSSFEAPVLIIASKNDIFFPATKVFKKAKKLFTGSIDTMTIEDKHLPSNKTMIKVCERIYAFDGMKN